MQCWTQSLNNDTYNTRKLSHFINLKVHREEYKIIRMSAPILALGKWRPSQKNKKWLLQKLHPSCWKELKLGADPLAGMSWKSTDHLYSLLRTKPRNREANGPPPKIAPRNPPPTKTLCLQEQLKSSRNRLAKGWIYPQILLMRWPTPQGWKHWKMLSEPHIKTLFIRSASSLTGSASSLPRSAGSESYKAGSATISPDLRATRLDLLLALQIYARSANISSDLQPQRLDLMLSLQI